MYEYAAEIIDIIDGDTLDVKIDLGFYLTARVRVRLLGVNTHETYGIEKDSAEYIKGMQEKQFVERWVNNTSQEYPFLIRTEKTGSFGRWLAIIEKKDGKILNDLLLEEFDVEY